MKKAVVEVIIPTYRPGREFEKVLERLSKQEYPIERIRIMNTEEEFWNPPVGGNLSAS